MHAAPALCKQGCTLLHVVPAATPAMAAARLGVQLAQYPMPCCAVLCCVCCICIAWRKATFAMSANDVTKLTQPQGRPRAVPHTGTNLNPKPHKPGQQALPKTPASLKHSRAAADRLAARPVPPAKQQLHTNSQVHTATLNTAQPATEKQTG